MAKQTINIGTTADDGTGETLRSALDKTNDNFDELYTDVGALEVSVGDLETDVTSLDSELSAFSEIVEVPDASTFTVLSTHKNKTLWINQTEDITFTLPSGLGEDFQVGIVGYTEFEVAFTVGGGLTLSPTGYTLVGLDGIPVALALVYRNSVWTVIGPESPTVVMVVYDAGWPATRPNAENVLAVGHTVAPTWLTADDAWLEAV